MAKKTRNSAPVQQDQLTKRDKCAQLIEKKRQEKEQEVLTDERVQKKIEEYEELEKLLEEEVDKQKKELDKQKEEIKNERQNLQQEIMAEKEKNKIWIEEEKKKILNQREQVINEIKNQEEEIRREYKLELETKWNAEYEQKRKNIDELIMQANKEADEIRQKAYTYLDNNKKMAHQLRIEAQQEKVELIDEARNAIEKKYETVTKEFEEKLKEIEEKEKRIKTTEVNLKLAQEDIQLDQEMIKNQKETLKKKLESCSPVKIEELNNIITELENLRSYDQQRIEKLNEEVMRFKRNMNDDNTKDINKIIEELEYRKEENQKLKDELANVPTSYELEELRAKAQNVDNLSRILQDEKRQRIEAEQRADNLSVGVIELEQNKRMAEALKTINAQLQEELTQINNMYKQHSTSKFPSLLEIDKELQGGAIFNPPATNMSLADIVKYIRVYGAKYEGLYYSEKTIRSFIASLAASKLLILQGLSGTGKSSLPRLFKEALGAEDALIPVQPSWRDNRELLGYDNDFTKRFKETEFTKYLYKASSVNNREKIWLIVLDEMNLARIEYYFADFLAILEKKPEEWIIPLVTSNEEVNKDNIPKNLVDGTSLFVSQNIWFIGTANRDESTFGITDKVYDRAQVLDFKTRENAFEVKELRPIQMSFSEFSSLIEEAQKDKKIGLTDEDWMKLDEIDELLKEKLDITFGNRIKMQINKFVPVYVACGGTKEEALDFLLTHKVLRKLENRYETYLKESLKELIEYIELQYGKDTFIESVSLITQKIERLGG